ncbi:MAG: autotransporter-associated beta strand repeat-containing protein, partial [Kiritimatiellae bacterium]|nr:autotransporter-associated beta strand repeat-containing protein [Kiritimatiellia bacterium]
AEVIVDKSATVYTVALNAGVALTNPDANTKNTLSFCKLSNDGAGLATVSCGAEFCVKYDVSLQAPVDFAGGASAWSLASGENAYERTFKGDIEFLDGLGITSAEPTWTVPSGSRLAAPSLMRNTTDNVNGSPAFRIEEGAYAHFGSVTAGRDNMYLSVLGEIEVDGLYTVRSCVRGESHFAGDFGYAGDVNAVGGTIRAGGLKRHDFSTDAGYPDDYSYIYPANLYIGAQGISQDTAELGIVMTGSAKSVYATADFAICGPDASSGLLVLESDTTFDTQEHTVTWTSGISGARTLTKTGDGTLAMSPYAGTSAFTGSIVVNGGTLAIQNDTLTATPVTLAAGTAIAVGANRTVPAAGTLTASGAVQVLVSGDMSEAKVGDSFPLFANCTAESFANLRLDASGLQNLPLRFGAYLKRNADGSVSLGITERGTVITIL